MVLATNDVRVGLASLLRLEGPLALQNMLPGRVVAHVRRDSADRIEVSFTSTAVANAGNGWSTLDYERAGKRTRKLDISLEYVTFTDVDPAEDAFTFSAPFIVSCTPGVVRAVMPLQLPLPRTMRKRTTPAKAPEPVPVPAAEPAPPAPLPAVAEPARATPVLMEDWRQGADVTVIQGGTIPDGRALLSGPSTGYYEALGGQSTNPAAALETFELVRELNRRIAHSGGTLRLAGTFNRLKVEETIV